MGKNYWMFVESPENFEVTRRLGISVHGVGSRYRKRAQRMQPGDRALFYVTKIRKWAATATITSRCFEDHTPTWKPNSRGDQFPHRVKLRPDILLDEGEFIDALALAPTLEYVKRWVPEDWPLAFHDALHLLPQRDFRLIEDEMKRNVSRRRSEPEEESEKGEEQPSVASTETATQTRPQEAPQAQVATEDPSAAASR